MPVLEDYGTLKNVSLADRWTSTHSITQGTNYDRCSGAGNTYLLAPFIIYPFYWELKVKHDGTSQYFLVTHYSGSTAFQLRVYKDKIGVPGDYYTIDATIARTLSIYLIDAISTPPPVLVDDVEAFTCQVGGSATPMSLYLSSISPDTFDVFWQRIYRKPLSLIDKYWLDFLQKRVMDPSDRDDPDDFISKRYPVASFPTKILTPRIDFHITHSRRKKPSPQFPHFLADSAITISAYLKKDTAIQGMQNVDAMDMLCSLIHEAMNFVFDDIPVLKDFSLSDPVFRFDERNLAWTGRVIVNALHFVEVF